MMATKKNGICNEKQAIFEGGFCQYATLLEATCDTQEMCFKRDIKLMNEGDADVKIAEAARAADCEVGNKVKCYLKVFEEEDNKEKPKVLEKCKSLKFTCPDLIHFPPTPKPTPCTPEPHVPCDEPWLEKEYKSQSWYAKAPTAPCHPCHLPKPKSPFPGLAPPTGEVIGKPIFQMPGVPSWGGAGGSK